MDCSTNFDWRILNKDTLADSTSEMCYEGDDWNPPACAVGLSNWLV